MASYSDDGGFFSDAFDRMFSKYGGKKQYDQWVEDEALHLFIAMLQTWNRGEEGKERVKKFVRSHGTEGAVYTDEEWEQKQKDDIEYANLRARKRAEEAAAEEAARKAAEEAERAAEEKKREQGFLARSGERKANNAVMEARRLALETETNALQALADEYDLAAQQAYRIKDYEAAEIAEKRRDAVYSELNRRKEKEAAEREQKQDDLKWKEEVKQKVKEFKKPAIAWLFELIPAALGTSARAMGDYYNAKQSILADALRRSAASKIPAGEAALYGDPFASGYAIAEAATRIPGKKSQAIGNAAGDVLTDLANAVAVENKAQRDYKTMIEDRPTGAYWSNSGRDFRQKGGYKGHGGRIKGDPLHMIDDEQRDSGARFAGYQAGTAPVGNRR